MVLLRAWFTVTVLAVFAGWYAYARLTTPPKPERKKQRALDEAQAVIDELEPIMAAPRRVVRERWQDQIDEIMEQNA